MKKPCRHIPGTFSLLLCLGLALSASAGESGDPVRLLLLEPVTVGNGVFRADAAAVLGVIQQALGNPARFDLLTETQLEQELRETLPVAIQEKLQRAEGFLQKARDRKSKRSSEETLESFQSAVVGLREVQGWLEDPEPLVRTLLGLAEALDAAGRGAEAEEAYREVFSLSPGYEPDPGQVRERLRVRFGRASQAVGQAEGGTLSLESNPEGATAVLDGLTVGQTPLEKARVTPGMHAVRFNKEGFAPGRQLVEVKPGERTEVDEQLQPFPSRELIRRIRVSVQQGTGSEPVEGLARQLLQESGEDAVLVGQLVRIEGKGLVLTLAVVRASDPPRVVGLVWDPEHEVEATQALASKIGEALQAGNRMGPPIENLGLDFSQGLLGKPGTKTPSAPTGSKVAIAPAPEGQALPPGALPPTPQPVPDVPAEGHRPFWTRWWFWTGVGAVVAATLATSLAVTLKPGTEVVQDPDRIHGTVLRNP